MHTHTHTHTHTHAYINTYAQHETTYAINLTILKYRWKKGNAILYDVLNTFHLALQLWSTG